MHARTSKNPCKPAILVLPWPVRFGSSDAGDSTVLMAQKLVVFEGLGVWGLGFRHGFRVSGFRVQGLEVSEFTWVRVDSALDLRPGV